MVPTEGAVGVAGWSFIVKLADSGETHPDALVTVYVYVPDGTLVTVKLVPVPVRVTPLGSLVIVHVPVAGSPLRATLPVDAVHVGCVRVPITGAVGESGCGFMVAGADAGDVQPSSLVTVNVYVPAAIPVSVTLVPVPV
jgi:hypothetical protein